MSHSKGIAIPATYKQAAADPNTDACLEIETGTLEEDMAPPWPRNRPQESPYCTKDKKTCERILRFNIR